MAFVIGNANKMLFDRIVGAVEIEVGKKYHTPLFAKGFKNFISFTCHSNLISK